MKKFKVGIIGATRNGRTALLLRCCRVIRGLKVVLLAASSRSAGKTYKGSRGQPLGNEKAYARGNELHGHYGCRK